MSEDLRDGSPLWMDDQFFKKVFTENNNVVNIKSYKVTPSSNNADHYCSIMFSANVHYEVDGVAFEQSLVIKTLPTVEGERKETLETLKIFETEIKMYTEIIPKYKALLRENGDDTEFGAKVFYASLEPVKAIVFEDLEVFGYRGLDNWGAPEEESNMAVLKLAKWHALSMHLHQEHKELFESVSNCVLKTAMAEMALFTDGVDLFCDMLSSLEGYEQFVEKFAKLKKPVLLNNCKELLRPVEDGNTCKIFVLNHGDFHAKNFMVKENPTELLLIDFQMCFWGPAAFDVLYFLYIMYRPEARINKREAILHLYFNQFLATLDLINFKGERPTFADLQEDLFQFKDLEMFLLTTFLSTIHKGMGVNNDEGEFDLDDAWHSADYQAQTYKPKSYVDEVKIQLPIYMKNKFFN